MWTLSNSRIKDQNMRSLTLSLSKELNISEPTVRRTLQYLRDNGLLECGDHKNKGVKIRLTKLGSMVLGR